MVEHDDEVRRRDGEALAEFSAAYGRLVACAYHAVRNFFRYDLDRVEDVVAETMARTYERWEKVRRHENPDGWVVVCAKNVCLEQARQERRRHREADRPAERVVDLSEEVVLTETISDALSELTKRQRDVAVLRYLMDCDEATTAAALGMTISRVRTAAHEARGRLRNLLDDVYLDDEREGLTP